MNANKPYINKFWRYLQKLFKPKGADVLVISKMLLLVLFITFHMLSSAQTLRKDSGVNGSLRHEITGRVLSATDGTPMQGVSIRIDEESLQIKSSQDGTFELTVRNRKGKIKFTNVGYRTQEINYTAGVSLTVKLIPQDNQLDEVEVVSTGYQKIPKERATGSFEFVDNKLFNRKVSTDFVSRLEDVVPGLSTNNQSQPKGNRLNINIRGESTLTSEKSPLIVIDGVPYESKFADFGLGNFNNINPNDIESVTILKDAAAASIWGARAGNGVIILTTKKGKFNEKTSISFNANVSLVDKPNLYQIPQISTSDYIDVIKELFIKGRYDSDLKDWMMNPQPIVKMMAAERDGLITNDQLETELGILSKIDMRDDFLKYIYRKAINQQYHVRINSGGEKVNSSVAVGYDRNLEELVTSSYSRLKLQSNTQFKPVQNLLLNFALSYSESKKKDSYTPVAYNAMAKGVGNFPYMQLADKNGNPLEVDFVGLQRTFRDTLSSGRLLDWSYVPLNELEQSSRIQSNREFLTSLNAQYSFPFGLTVQGFYAFQRNLSPISQWRGLGDYMLRNELNYFATWNDKQIIWNLPLGDKFSELNWKNYSHQGRLMAEFNRKLGHFHQVNLLGGFDIREVGKDLRMSVYHGFDVENGTFQSIHAGKEVPYLNGLMGVNYLPEDNQYQSFINRFISYYANGAYTYADRYILSGSVRKDASNLFGVKANDRGRPFWSLGAAWILSKEHFLEQSMIQFLKLRATYGYNGNVNTAVSALPIINIQTSANNITGQNYATIRTPPNPNLRWERVGNFNIGLDFALKGNRFSGAVEYYRKTPKDLVASGEIDPTVGFTTLTMNTANLDTKGWDISLNVKPIKLKNWEWNSNLVFAYSRTKVTKSFLASDNAEGQVSYGLGRRPTAIEGMDLYSLLTYQWAGLDPLDGTPRGYLNGEVSKDYLAILNAKVNTLENHGSLVPLYFGSFRNSLGYKAIELSWNVSYQLGHRFLRTTFSNATFLTYGAGHADYAQRWQKEGDEAITDVPAFTYPNNSFASKLFASSAALVENAGQIKLRDIQVTILLSQLSKYGLKNFKAYVYAQNLGTIWRANKKGIDSEYGDWYSLPLMTSIGINFNL